jgi:hypothetical protein
VSKPRFISPISIPTHPSNSSARLIQLLCVSIDPLKSIDPNTVLIISSL